MNLDEEIAHYLAGLRVADSTIEHLTPIETTKHHERTIRPDLSKADFDKKLAELRQNLIPAAQSQPSIGPKHGLPFQCDPYDSPREDTSIQSSADARSNVCHGPPSSPGLLPSEGSLSSRYGPSVARRQGSQQRFWDQVQQHFRDQLDSSRHRGAGSDASEALTGEVYEKLKIDRHREAEKNSFDAVKGEVYTEISHYRKMKNAVVEAGNGDTDEIVDGVLNDEKDTVDIVADNEMKIIQCYATEISPKRGLGDDNDAEGENCRITGAKGAGNEPLCSKGQAVIVEDEWDDCEIGES